MKITNTVIAGLMGIGIAFTASAALAEGDPIKGKNDFKKCFICHKLKEGKRSQGPHLVGIIGRQAGTAANYKYSPDYIEAGQKGLKWDAEQLIAYLENPKDFLKGYLKKDRVKTRMLQKFKKMDFRENVVAYLESLQKK